VASLSLLQGAGKENNHVPESYAFTRLFSLIPPTAPRDLNVEQPVNDASRHCRRHSQRAVNLDEVVVVARQRAPKK
jgi:hypothetical protein